MKKTTYCLLLTTYCLLFTALLHAGTYYVGKGKETINFFTDIQSAVNVASDGDLIIVSNGTYTLKDQISVTNLLTIQSVYGARTTIIDGSTSNRCFYLSDTNIVIDGFTLKNGDSELGHGGGIFCGGYLPIVKNCIIKDCFSGNWGGGICKGNVYNCIIKNNIAEYGGGAFNSIVYNSSIIGNSGDISGGGIANGTAVNCVIVNNCVKGRHGTGGGARVSYITNSIVYYNYAAANSNRVDGVFAYCCTTPDAADGIGNITEEPMLLSATHIATNSPCVGAGLVAVVMGADIDGEAWKNPPSIGCDEIYLNAITGGLSVAIDAERVYSYVNNTLTFNSDIHGKLNKCTWTFGDGNTKTDKNSVDHFWKNQNDYKVILTAFNNTFPAGISATTTVHIVPKIHYVKRCVASAVLPYSTWQTAAGNIQDAVDIADDNGTVLVTNGTYHLAHQILVEKDITVKSVNGPEKTICLGNVSNNYSGCFYLDSPYVTVCGFTVTNGYAIDGGGFYCYFNSDIITNCLIVGNIADDLGGGACRGIFNNCIINNNIANMVDGEGGGATADNCIISGNKAGYGGGMTGSSINNSIIFQNYASESGGGGYSSDFSNCIISNNVCQNYGGGARYCKIVDSVIVGNLATNYGGGVYSSYLMNCSILGNTALKNGGGAFNGALTNCLIAKMNFAKNGGGVYFDNNNSSLINCTVAGNNAGENAGGVVCSNGGSVINSIIYNNQSISGEQNWKTYLSNDLFSFCCTTPTNNLPGGTQCIPDDPMFVSLGDDYSLQEGSPCIDAGYNMAWMNPPATDLAGNERLYDGTVDMGCYEFVPEPCYLLFIIYYLIFIIRKFI